MPGNHTFSLKSCFVLTIPVTTMCEFNSFLFESLWNHESGAMNNSAVSLSELVFDLTKHLQCILVSHTVSHRVHSSPDCTEKLLHSIIILVGFHALICGRGIRVGRCAYECYVVLNSFGLPASDTTVVSWMSGKVVITVVFPWNGHKLNTWCCNLIFIRSRLEDSLPHRFFRMETRGRWSVLIMNFQGAKYNQKCSTDATMSTI